GAPRRGAPAPRRGLSRRDLCVGRRIPGACTHRWPVLPRPRRPHARAGRARAVSDPHRQWPAPARGVHHGPRRHSHRGARDESGCRRLPGETVRRSRAARRRRSGVERQAPGLRVIARLAAAMLLVLLITAPMAAEEPKRFNVLLLYSEPRLGPALIAVDEAFRSALEARLDAGVYFYTEYLDLSLF